MESGEDGVGLRLTWSLRVEAVVGEILNRI